MPDDAYLDLDGLRRLLREQPRPSPAQMRRRRDRQVTAAVTVTMIAAALVGAALATDLRSAPTGGSSARPDARRDSAAATGPEAGKGPPGPDPGHQPGPGARVAGLTVTSSGGVYVLVNTCADPAAGRCDDHVLAHSADLGGHWTAVGPAPAGTALLAAGDAALWVDAERVGGSTDGGRTWRTWRLDPRREWATSDHTSDVAGGAAWFTLGPRVYVATGGRRPARTPSRPPGIGNVFALAAVDASRAVVMGARNNASRARWFETDDGGAQWTRVDDPCAGTVGEGSLFARLTIAPDGSRWAVCVPERERDPDGGQGPRVWSREIVVSTDDGRTWRRRGAIDVPSSGPATTLHPTNEAVSWLVAPGGDVHRIAGGLGRRVAQVTGHGGYVWQFAALNSRTAMYVDESEPFLHVTRDRGDTWTSHRLPGPR